MRIIKNCRSETFQFAIHVLGIVNVRPRRTWEDTALRLSRNLRVSAPSNVFFRVLKNNSQVSGRGRGAISVRVAEHPACDMCTDLTCE